MVPAGTCSPHCFPPSSNELLKPSFKEQGEVPSHRDPFGSSCHLVPPLKSPFPKAFPLHFALVLSTFGFGGLLQRPPLSPCRPRPLWRRWLGCCLRDEPLPCCLRRVHTGNASSRCPLAGAASAQVTAQGVQPLCWGGNLPVTSLVTSQQLFWPCSWELSDPASAGGWTGGPTEVPANPWPFCDSVILKPGGPPNELLRSPAEDLEVFSLLLPC